MAEAAKPIPVPTQPNGNPGFRVAPAPGVDPTKQPSQPVIREAPFVIQALGAKPSWIRFLVYGVPGAGKTELLASAIDVPEMQDVLLVNADQGELTITQSPRVQNGHLIRDLTVSSFSQMRAIQEFAQKHCVLRDRNDVEGLKRLESVVTRVPVDDIKEPMRIKTLIIDTISEVEAFSLYKLQGLDPDKGMPDDPSDIDKLEFKEWGQNNVMIKLLLRAFRNLPIHLLVAAHSAYVQDERKKLHYAPALSGKLAAQVQGIFDLVGFLVTSSEPNPTTGEYDRRILIQPGEVGNAKFDAKNRLARYRQSYWDNPNMGTILRDTGYVRNQSTNPPSGG